jgi:hypothetical protein
MNSDVEDLLREGMERFTRDLRAPAGLTRQAARQRRRRLAVRSLAGTAAALTAGAVALAAVLVSGERRGSVAPPVVNTAFVMKRVDGALSAAGPATIAQMAITIRNPYGATTAEVWAYGDQWRKVTDSAAGHPAYDQGLGRGSVYTLVSYAARTWARQQGLAGPLPRSGGCQQALNVLLTPGLHDVVSTLRAAISCGALAVTGRQRVDGVEAIELTSRRGGPVSETLWVSPGTYLPLRVTHSTLTGIGVFRQRAVIRWLPLTARNLAKLTVPIPAGFRELPLALILRELAARAGS